MQDFNPPSKVNSFLLRSSFLPFLSFLMLITISIGCGSSSGKEEQRICAAGEPRAIFKAEDVGVHEHKFLLDGQFSQEHIRFKTDELLSIMQRGCDTLVQTFELSVADSIQSWPSFRRVLVERFYRYANLDARLYSLSLYADFLEVIPADFPIAQPVYRAPGLTIRFFKVPTSEVTTWQIVYEQDLTLSK